MNITKVSVNWYEQYANRPVFVVQVDVLPQNDKHLRFRNTRELFYAEDKTTGLVQFYSWGGNQDRGYGGRHYAITLEDGTEVVLKGPWSSRAGVMNKHFEDVACLDITYDTGEKYLQYSGAITLEKLLEWMDAHYDEINFWVNKVTDSTGEITYEPCKKNGEYKDDDSSSRKHTYELILRG